MKEADSAGTRVASAAGDLQAHWSIRLLLDEGSSLDAPSFDRSLASEMDEKQERLTRHRPLDRHGDSRRRERCLSEIRELLSLRRVGARCGRSPRRARSTSPDSSRSSTLALVQAGGE